ncbi:MULTISPECIES: DsbA family protein [Streptomyces]|uniref:2-hydroxychromene-2-carboxylate isomerase n=1 Tax=Streptomyces morookaense TaxID=1970 RepID=A0A7Y7AZ99_STRMO|nr:MULTISPECIES: DsbA family protein [Streptomyces]MCC2276963.1 DsbA family protein [Streptomyces sp. ET3-23]NVK76100.1 DsbA family protein [Streptomyces morookaense]
MTRRPRQPRLYFNFRSPYSWMALRQLDALLPPGAEPVDRHPYWDPDAEIRAALARRGAEVLYTPMTKAKHLYVLADTKRLARHFGYVMAWPVDVDPCWEVPHLAWLHARRGGTEEVLYRALVAARWERGEDICDPHVLHRVAQEAGLDGPALAAAHRDPGIREEAVEALEAAYHDDVFGVPYFMAGRQRFWGLDRLGLFLRALTAESGPEPLEGVPHEVRHAVGSYDRDTAGGCG